MTPFYAHQGYNPTFQMLVHNADTVPAVQQRLQQIDDIRTSLTSNLTTAQQRQAEYYNRHHAPARIYETGQLVWLDRRNIKTSRPCAKLDVKKLGPFKIRRKLHDNAYELDLPTSYRIHPVFHVSLLSPFRSRPTITAAYPSTRPRIMEVVDTPTEMTVRKILYRRTRTHGYEYFTVWENMSKEHSSWNTEEQLLKHDKNARQKIDDYYKRVEANHKARDEARAKEGGR